MTECVQNDRKIEDFTRTFVLMFLKKCLDKDVGPKSFDLHDNQLLFVQIFSSTLNYLWVSPTRMPSLP